MYFMFLFSKKLQEIIRTVARRLKVRQLRIHIHVYMHACTNTYLIVKIIIIEFTLHVYIIRTMNTLLIIMYVDSFLEPSPSLD